MSPTFPIESYKGLGPVRLGMTTSEVRAALRTEVRTFKKTPTSDFLTDAFDDFGIHVYYKHPGVCEAVEAGFPANPTFRGHLLIGKPYAEVRTYLKSLDSEIEEDGAVLVSRKFGISIYSSSAGENPNDPVEGVMVFEKDYYD